MRFFISIVIISLASCGATPSPAEKDDKQLQADSRYQLLVEKVSRRATADDFKALQENYILSSHYHPYDIAESTDSKALFEHMQSQQWQQCATQAQKILNYNFISLNAHFAAMVCANKTDDYLNNDKHKYILKNLIDTIARSGDGESPQSAFMISSTTQLRAFVRLQGFEITGQKLMHKKEKTYDVMTLKNVTDNNTVQWYFDISSQWQRALK